MQKMLIGLGRSKKKSKAENRFPIAKRETIWEKGGSLYEDKKRQTKRISQPINETFVCALVSKNLFELSYFFI